MSRFLKMIVVGVIGVFIYSGVAGGVETPLGSPQDVPIGGEVTGVFTFSVTTIDILSGNEYLPGDTANFRIDFDSTGVAVPPGNPWAIAMDALRVQYSTNYGEWGVTLSTSNVTGFPGMFPLFTHPGDDGEWGDPIIHPDWMVDNGRSYTGLINDAMKEDPSMRATLGWQAFNMVSGALPYNSPNDPVLAIIDDTQGAGPDAIAHEISGKWNADWRYVADISNMTYNPASGNPNHLDSYDVSDVYNLAADPDLYNYLYSIYGFATGASLLPSKVSNTLPNDMTQATGDVAIYFAARYVGKYYDEDHPLGADFLLPAGRYSTVLWVRLLHL